MQIGTRIENCEGVKIGKIITRGCDIALLVTSSQDKHISKTIRIGENLRFDEAINLLVVELKNNFCFLDQAEQYEKELKIIEEDIKKQNIDKSKITSMANKMKSIAEIVKDGALLGTYAYNIYQFLINCIS
jgi:hypothetical protein